MLKNSKYKKQSLLYYNSVRINRPYSLNSGFNMEHNHVDSDKRVQFRDVGGGSLENNYSAMYPDLDMRHEATTFSMLEDNNSSGDLLITGDENNTNYPSLDAYTVPSSSSNDDHDNILINHSRTYASYGDINDAVSVTDGKLVEYQWNNLSWTKETNHVPCREGIVGYTKCRVKYRRKKSNIVRELYTFSEGNHVIGKIEKEFPYLCGEVVSAEPLASVSRIKQVFTCMDPNEITSSEDGLYTGGIIKKQKLSTISLDVDQHTLVMVFRTYMDTLALQLMPSIFSKLRLTPGLPLFTHTHRDVVGCVGNPYSEFMYIFDGAPNSYSLYKVPDGLHSKSDRMFLIVVDRRNYTDAVNDNYIRYTEHENATRLTSVISGFISVALNNNNDTSGIVKHQPAYKYNQNDILYIGVVNNLMQLTDVINGDKKYKPPKQAVVVVIDAYGITSVLVENTRVVSYWTHKDSNTSYSILPRHYFDARNNIITLNTESKLKRSKSQEYLI